MNIQILKNIFAQAYKWAINHIKPIHIDKDISDQIQHDPITVDPFYQYVYYTKKMEFSNKKIKYLPEYSNVYNVLGRDRKTIIN